jgi:hypothetical protein
MERAVKGVRAIWTPERIENRPRLGLDVWNSKRATAAVMRYGYWRVEFFGGYEQRCGKGGSRAWRVVGVATQRGSDSPDTLET